MRNLSVLMLMAAVVLAGCGGGSSSPTAPTIAEPSPVPAAPQPPAQPGPPVHSTLVAPGTGFNRPGGDGVWSERAGAYDRQIFDDFVLSSPASIRTIEWQGYRDVRYQPASYYVSFVPDRGERTIFVEPSQGYRPPPLWSATFRQDQVNEQLDVTLVCESSPQQRCGLYNYTVTLTTPFAAAAGTRYWIMIQAESPTIVGWAWRKGTADNGRSLTNLAGTTFNWDLAFALRP